MFIVVVRHWCRPGMVERARRRVDGNGELMARRAGFVYRHRIETPEDPARVSTITAWADEASCVAWDEWKKARDAAAGPDAELSAAALFERVESERYHVVVSHEPAAQP
jgi:heme-degrading monooxygenase HmoA